MTPKPEADSAAVVGPGYTGLRVLEALPEALCIGRRRPPDVAAARFVERDFDATPIEPLTLPPSTALLYTVPPRPDGDSDLRLQALLDAIDTPPIRVVYLSTSGVYGDRQGRLTDESTPTAPVNARAVRRLDAEARVRAWCDARGTSATVLRVPGIYGPGRLGVERIERGESVLAEADANPGNRIHVDDLVRCCIAALDPATPPGIYNLGDGDHRSSTWFATRVASILGLNAPPQIPRAEAVRRFSARRMSFLNEARVLDTSRMRDELGVEPLYGDAEDGIVASLAAEGRLRR